MNETGKELLMYGTFTSIALIGAGKEYITDFAQSKQLLEKAQYVYATHAKEVTTPDFSQQYANMPAGIDFGLITICAGIVVYAAYRTVKDANRNAKAKAQQLLKDLGIEDIL